MILAKYDNSGVEQWIRKIGATGYGTRCEIAVNSLDNVYVSVEAIYSIHLQLKGGGIDKFLAKYNSSGGKQWRLRDVGCRYKISIDSQNNIYARGNGTYLSKYNIEGELI